MESLVGSAVLVLLLFVVMPVSIMWGGLGWHGMIEMIFGKKDDMK